MAPVNQLNLEAVGLFLAHQNVTELLRLIYTQPRFIPLINHFKNQIINNFLLNNPYEALFWSNFDGSMQNFVAKLHILRICEPADQTIENLIRGADFRHLFYNTPVNRIRQFKLHMKMLIDTGLSTELALIFTSEYGNDLRAFKILWTIASKYSSYIEHAETDESNFTQDMISHLLEVQDDEFDRILQEVDNMIEDTGASAYVVLELIVFYNEDEIGQFLRNLESGFSSEHAFKLIIENVVPTNEKIEIFNHFKGIFTEKNSFTLVFTPYLLDLPDDINYSEEDIQRMVQLQTIHGNNFVDHM